MASTGSPPGFEERMRDRFAPFAAHGISHPLLIFLHLPKTGGTTLSSIFRSQYQVGEIQDHESLGHKPQKLDELTSEQRESIKGVMGHYYHGLHQAFGQWRTCRYFTMLREPVDRVISSYFFLKTYPGYERVREMSLAEFVEREQEARNLQTLMIGGLGPIGSDGFHVADIEKAKNNLQAFDSIGVTEHFDGSVFLLAEKFGWPTPFYTTVNVTRGRLSCNQVSADDRACIERANQLDIELHSIATGIVLRRLADLGDGARMRLAAFKEEQARRTGEMGEPR